MSLTSNPVTKLGMGYRHYGDIPFGIRLADRLMHLYVIGQTGTGKSTLLLNMALQDARAGIGFCLVDPHGDLASELSARLEVPHIAWNVADPQSPFGYNPLTHVSASFRPLITSGLIDALKRQWSDAWGARMEHLLRYALLEQPSADIRDILRLYVEKDFRQAVVKRVTDPQGDLRAGRTAPVSPDHEPGRDPDRQPCQGALGLRQRQCAWRPNRL